MVSRPFAYLFSLSLTLSQLTNLHVLHFSFLYLLNKYFHSGMRPSWDVVHSPEPHLYIQVDDAQKGGCLTYLTYIQRHSSRGNHNCNTEWPLQSGPTNTGKWDARKDFNNNKMNVEKVEEEKLKAEIDFAFSRRINWKMLLSECLQNLPVDR